VEGIPLPSKTTGQVRKPSLSLFLKKKKAIKGIPKMINKKNIS